MTDEDVLLHVISDHIRPRANLFRRKLGFSGNHGQETGRGISRSYEGNFQTHFWQNSTKPSCVGSASIHAFRRRVEMHGDFTGELAAWLGLRGTDTGHRIILMASRNAWRSCGASLAARLGLASAGVGGWGGDRYR